MSSRRKSTLFDEEPVKEKVSFKVNEEFARRFQHNKEREERQRLEAKYARQSLLPPGEGGDEDPSSDEPDEEDLLPDEDTEARFLETLLRIRAKDPAIYDPTVKFFADAEIEGEEGEGEVAGAGKEGEKKKKDKPITLREVIARQALEGGPEASSSDGEDGDREDEGEGRGGHRGAYDEEQRRLRREFLQAAQSLEAGGPEGEGDALGGGLLKKSKKKGRGEEEAGAQGGPKNVQSVLDKLFGRDEPDLPEEERFLRSYLQKRTWRKGAGSDSEEEDEEEGEGMGGEEGPAALSEDEAAVERQEEFEHRYNFRFEEPEGAKIATYPRRIEGTIRKEDSSRKRQREAKKEREEERKREQEADVKRLKGLKRKQIESTVKEMEDVAGPGARASEAALAKLLEGDFDPELWDKQMATMFGDDYYGAEDDEAAALEDEERGEMGLGLGRGAGAEGGEEGEAEEEGREGPDMAAAAAHRAELQRLLGEYHNLDYEDDLGGTKVKFRYRRVESQDYGLSLEDILALSDKELNRLVGLKRLAAYREDGGQLSDRKLKAVHYQLQDIRKEKGLQGPVAGPPAYKEKKREREAEEGREEKRQKTTEEPQAPRQKQDQPKKDKPKQPDAKPRPQAAAPKQQQQAAAAAKPADAAPPSAAARRLASFAKPTLASGPGAKAREEREGCKPKKVKGPAAPPPKVPVPEGLTKAQRKNFKRSVKRKEGKPGAEAQA